MVVEIHVNRENISPAMYRELCVYYGINFHKPVYKPAAIPVSDSDTIGHFDPDNEEISLNFKLGGSTPLGKIVDQEKTGIICDVVENSSDIRHPPVPRSSTSYVKIAQSNTIQSCQRKELLFTEEKEKVQVQSEKRKSTVVVVEGNEQEEDIKTVSIRCSSKEDSKENFKQGKPGLTLVDGKEKVADKDEDEGQKTVGKRSISKADSREQIPQEKLALTLDKGKFMDFIIFMRGLILVVFANYKKLKSKAFTWMILPWVLSSILRLTKKSKNSHWKVCWILVVCVLFGNITAMALKGKVFVSLEDTNSIKIVATPGESTGGTPKWTAKIDGETKLAVFNGIVAPKFQDKIHIVNRTTIHIANLSSKEWRGYWTYQKGFDTPIQTKQLSEYVDPVCADNLTVVGLSTTSITVMWNSGLDRGHDIITILQYRSDGSSDWISAYNTTEHTNQEVNFSIPDLKQGTSYDIRVLTLGENESRLICESNLLTEKSQLEEQIFVSLEDTNSIKIVATPGESTVGTPKWTTKIDGEIKLAIFNGIITPEFQDKIHILNRTTIHIAKLSSKEWRSYWTYQRGFDTPIQTKQLSKYVDPVCADNLTVVGSSTTSITVMWNSGLDRGHDMVTILQYHGDGSSDWMSAYNTTEHTNQEVNFSIPDLKQGTSYDIRLLTLGENGSRLICESNLLTENSKPEEQTIKKSSYVKIIVVSVVGSLILLSGMLIYCGYKRLHKKKNKNKTEANKDEIRLKDVPKKKNIIAEV
ncbi:uncharacterized protein [Mytilus edulis]|uniref:uncharacterized protein n=1 Tax=Mytilus edulis TaxID=6550 RepID=UPI0039EFBEA9